MGIKEVLHNIVHKDEFDHRPSLDELTEEPLVGGRELPPLPKSLADDGWEAIEDELPEVPDHLHYMHTRHQVMWQLEQAKKNRAEQERGTSSTDPYTESLEQTVYELKKELHQTQQDDGREFC